ncbi:hypothetical protein [Nocardia sputorum]|uniref:Uncharacterized protein n=1 Tax=Nocardia sputorum TaxID=2984338 RepID=A0ABN6TZ47_9NOCA|nr:hypothetical protein [Nocardia sputorum]BDT98186.1 hypothetical protein IFM12276_12150 [Nocardia sputorum]
MLVELVGDDDVVSVELVQPLGLTGREAVPIIETARTGSSHMREYLLGQPRPEKQRPSRRDNQGFATR